ncbi:MAG: Methyltransferase domain protein [Mycobacterium sp.]|nr:Methyltransferase domain protein [Mycobacterium sp.]
MRFFSVAEDERGRSGSGGVDQPSRTNDRRPILKDAMVEISPQVSYRPAVELCGSYCDILPEIGRRNGVKAIAELGGGATPILADTEVWGFVKDRVVFDISADQLSKADGEVEKRVVDLCLPISEDQDSYDMVFSRMLCEHLPDPRTFHQNCFNLLRSGGLAVHIFPTLFATPFLVNWLLPETVSTAILRVVWPGRMDDPKTRKFPAFYRWCTGPTLRTLQRYESIGFEVQEWSGCFGHDYYRRIPLLDAAEQTKSRLLLRHPVPWLTSYAVVVLRKP